MSQDDGTPFDPAATLMPGDADGILGEAQAKKILDAVVGAEKAYHSPPIDESDIFERAWDEDTGTWKNTSVVIPDPGLVETPMPAPAAFEPLDLSGIDNGDGELSPTSAPSNPMPVAMMLAGALVLGVVVLGLLLAVGR